MITSYFPKYVALFAICVLCVGALDTFIAAVYEHAVILPNRTETPVSKEEALLLMNKNIDVLENAVKLAARQVLSFLTLAGILQRKFETWKERGYLEFVKDCFARTCFEQGAHIIVTPEDGIYGWVFTRETIYPYLEDIPDPEVNWIPCTDPQRFGYTPVQQRLSCLAKDNSIYVVANIGDKKPCNASDPQCPPDGRYQYNTDVVFDSEGRLVARYHKYNLFAPEIQFDFPKDSESVTFETPFGKFGIFTCFDIFSHTPAVVVVDEFQVDSVLYPVAWYNTLPLLSAVPFHSAWARAMRVNLLAANTHNTSMHMTGSGIYAPEAVKVYHYDMETESGQLMLSELKSRPRSEPTYPAAVDWSAYARSVKPFLSEQSNFPGMIYFDELTFIELKRNTGNYTVCQKDLCCHLTYKMSEKRTDEVYALGAFDGLHTVEGYLRTVLFELSSTGVQTQKSVSCYDAVRSRCVMICTLLKCQISDLRTCGEPVGSAFTKLEEFSLSGTFATRYVFPQIILSGSQLAPERHYEVLRDGRLRSRSRTPLPVLVLALYGRVFDKDPPRLGQGPRRLE